jgi:predicted phosphoribosyltransferase
MFGASIKAGRGEIAMIFSDRTEAGRALASRLAKFANHQDVVVLGVPRGGVPVAFEVAAALRAPLDVFLLRKLGVPGHEELAFGAIASGDIRVLDEATIGALFISPTVIEEVTLREQHELQRREIAYRGNRPALSVTGKTAILIDDGIATGASILAGIHALRKLTPAKIIVAVPVAPRTTSERLAHEAGEVVCEAAVDSFRAVGQFYNDFSQVTDEQVIELLAQNQKALAPATI